MTNFRQGKTKYIRMYCPDCGEVLTNYITQIGMGRYNSANELYVEDIAGMKFYCQDCETGYYVEEPTIVSDRDFI
ncbi:hypothetical protein FDJ58_gp164 [Bacillus phage SIOphi]|uniref:Uncharacterized protein n=1 Tax=Bacillus phage SIOphi TaxID=1285382 RepID=R4JDX0_9CAUD|nr:hypothetical protein FDJ58_gp164 [Bacillus phage SIOphi]AGK86972.1 hypothetical protein SIOphi_00820 [Bacillus phage SIOphi]